MKINQKLLKKNIKRTKRLNAKFFKEKEENLLGEIKRLNREVCLVVAEFKCQNPNCLCETKLQLHHLIMRPTRGFMDFVRYVCQRHYWANCIILCFECHKRLHNKLKENHKIDEKRKLLCLSQTFIDRLKQKYKTEEEFHEFHEIRVRRREKV